MGTMVGVLGGIGARRRATYAPPASDRLSSLAPSRPVRHAAFTQGLTLSSARRQSGPMQALVSTATHAAIILAAVAATSGAATKVADVLREEELVFLPQLKELVKPPEPVAPADVVERIVAANPPPRGFQTIAAVTDIPTSIPPVDLNQRALDPKDFSGAGVEGGIARGIVGGVGPVDDAPADIGQVVYRTEQLDELARIVEAPSPVYPAPLRSVGLEGQVHLRFIIDTLGRVEPGSVEIRNDIHQLFAQAAREAIVRARFLPARLNGQAVRQLTEQRINFRVQVR